MDKRMTKKFLILALVLGVLIGFVAQGFAQGESIQRGAFSRNATHITQQALEGVESSLSSCPMLCSADRMMNVDSSDLDATGSEAFAFYPYSPLEKVADLPEYSYPELGKMSKFMLEGPKDFILVNTSIVNAGAMSSVAWGDYDNDGDLDLLISGADQTKGFVLSTKVYRNDPSPVNAQERIFTDINAELPGLASSSVVWVDYDGDGYLDIFISGLATDKAPYDVYVSKIYRNEAHPTIPGGVKFVEINTTLLPVRDGSVAWGDYNYDGYPDVAISGLTVISSDGHPVYATKIYRNDPDPADPNQRIFTDIDAGLPGIAFSSMAWGDYDNDGDLDLLISGSTSTAYGTVSRIYRNDFNPEDPSEITFTDINAGLPGLADSSVAWADYNYDGYLDLLVSGVNFDGKSYNYISRIYRNDPVLDNPEQRIFTDIKAGLVGLSAGSVAWGDYNSDGYLDIVLTGLRPVNGQLSSVSKIYRSDPDPADEYGRVFTDADAGLINVESGSVAWGDYDSDGDEDLILTGIPLGVYEAGASVVKLYRNNFQLSAEPESDASAGEEEGFLENSEEEASEDVEQGIFEEAEEDISTSTEESTSSSVEAEQ